MKFAILTSNYPTMNSEYGENFKHTAFFQALRSVSEHCSKNGNVVVYKESLSNLFMFAQSCETITDFYVDSPKIDAAIIIGGDGSVIHNYHAIKHHVSSDLIFPIGSTSGAAERVYSQVPHLSPSLREDLKDDGVDYDTLLCKIIRQVWGLK